MTGAQDRIRVGFFGKLPSRGDFVRMGLSRAFAGAWDQWLQAVMPEARQVLGPEWGDVWSRMPVWRFSFGAGFCGATPVSGVWLASADCVGRRFPLLIAAECATANDAFLDAAEQIGRDSIMAALTPDGLARNLGDVPLPLPAMAPARVAMRWWRRIDDGLREHCTETWPDADVFLGMLTA